MNQPSHPLADLRSEYRHAQLDESDVARDPYVQFAAWFDAAVAARIREPNAMTLATVGAGGQPAARIVLLKGVDERGFVFYTNRDSRKGRDLAANPQAALVFLWLDLERQVRVEGTVERVADAEADAYFAGRPRLSRIAAWASQQSAPIAGRRALEQAFEDANRRHSGADVPRPPRWGGYRVVPQMVEFWQGRESRLHDRIAYLRDNAGWKVVRLAP
jgi:pyridoxamine 5'-phosphate oxidase